jgi:hypothetical protein
MSIISFRVSSNTLRQFARAAKKLENADELLKDRRELLREIRQEQSERWAEHFMSEGSGEWDETSMFQQRRRVQEGYAPQPTLFRSGSTFSWFDAQNRRGRVNAASITWNFTNREGAYTVSHHTGYDLGGSTVPARELWPLERYEDEIADQIEEWVMDKLGGLF